MAEQSIIQIKRSAATEAPASLANGEIAYSFASNTFFIGDMQNGGAPIKIAGGEFNYIDDVTAGTLAAGKALVVNSTSFIDQFKTGSLQVGADTAVTSISTTIGLGSDSVLPTTSAVKAYVDGASSVNSFSFDAASEEITLTTTTGDSFTADLSAFATEAQVATAKGEAATDASTKAATAYTNAVAYTDGREVAITTAYQAYADQAEADAISTAAADATSKAGDAYSNAVSTAAADASSKAATAYSNAVSYTDGAVADKITLEDLSGGTGVTYDNLSGEISIGQAVGTTDNVTFNNVTVGGILNSDDITASTVTITGNLVVQGTTTTVNTETIELADNQIVLNSNHTGAPTLDAGFVVERGDESDVSFLWDETNDRWSTGSEGIFAGNITTADAQITGGNISGLSAAIAVADGGTGLSSVTANALLVGNGTSALTELTGSAYQVLQLDASGVPVFGGLDGGTF